MKLVITLIVDEGMEEQVKDKVKQILKAKEIRDRLIQDKNAYKEYEIIYWSYKDALDTLNRGIMRAMEFIIVHSEVEKIEVVE